ncbi:MAG: transposase [Nitrososphaerota archaeon]|nr:transposase [Nitrososphaerota archaeon]
MKLHSTKVDTSSSDKTRSRVQPAQIVLSVKQDFSPDERLYFLMNTFRQMLNDCIRIGLAQNTTSFMSLRYSCYPELSKYDVPSAYKNNAISRASGILSNFRKLLKKGKHSKTPYCKKPMFTNCRGLTLRLEGRFIVLPYKTRIPINEYVLKKIVGTELRSVTVSTNSVSISYTSKKQIDTIRCKGVIGIDTNEGNIQTADSIGNLKRFPMEDVVAMTQKYREVKRHFKRNDARIQKLIFAKYGKLQACKCQAEIHKVSARIVKYALKNQLAIALEDIKGIRNLFINGNGKGPNYRSRMNSWAYGEFQKQIDYKAGRLGLPVVYVNARGTSAKCSTCGSKMSPEENRIQYCPQCNQRVDRDKNAGINIMKRGWEKFFSMRFQPIGLSSEVVMRNPMKEQTVEVILRADGSQSTQYPQRC